LVTSGWKLLLPETKVAFHYQNVRDVRRRKLELPNGITKLELGNEQKGEWHSPLPHLLQLVIPIKEIFATR
jgi:hypothetical protein